MTRVLALALTLLALRAAADPTPLAEAWRHYHDLEYDQALAALAPVAKGADDPAVRAEARLLEGFVDVALDREEEALLAFREAVRQSPTLTAPPRTSPKVLAVLDHARVLEHQRAAERAAVTVELLPIVAPPVASRPVEVRVLIGHAFPGLSARLIVLDRGASLESILPIVEHEGAWLTQVPAALVRPTATLELHAELLDDGDTLRPTASASLALPAHAAALRIEAAMTGAMVTVDRAPVGRLPLAEPVGVAPGRHKVAVDYSRAGIAQDVEVLPGEIARVSLRVDERSPIPIARAALIALAGALGITSGVLFARSAQLNTQYRDDVVRNSGGLPTTSYAQAAPVIGEARALQAAAISTAVVGGVVLVGGLAMFAIRRPPRAAITR